MELTGGLNQSLECLVLSSRESLAKATIPALRLCSGWVGENKDPFLCFPTLWLQPKALFTQSSLVKNLFRFSRLQLEKAGLPPCLILFPRPWQERCPIPEAFHPQKRCQPTGVTPDPRHDREPTVLVAESLSGLGKWRLAGAIKSLTLSPFQFCLSSLSQSPGIPRLSQVHI